MRRIKDKIKRTHWSMQFASNNLPVSAACMVLSNHIKNNIKCIQDGDYILAPNTHNFYSARYFLTVKEHTCILILTKDALSEVGRLLVEDSPCVGRSILKDQRR